MSDEPQNPPPITNNDPRTAEDLLPLIYKELRELAAWHLEREPPGQTLQPTALVHEVYIKLQGSGRDWNDRRHFFAAAAKAMRQILLDGARCKNRIKRGGGRQRVELDDWLIRIASPVEDMVAFDEALEQLARVDPEAAELVSLRQFSGLTTEEAADLMGIPGRSAYRTWEFARAWLFRRLNPGVVPPAMERRPGRPSKNSGTGPAPASHSEGDAGEELNPRS
jgi:RNA polymerase sigma factor (TIGR02999 family)